jgi:hypothetical protein
MHFYNTLGLENDIFLIQQYLRSSKLGKEEIYLNLVFNLRAIEVKIFCHEICTQSRVWIILELFGNKSQKNT